MLVFPLSHHFSTISGLSPATKNTRIQDYREEICQIALQIRGAGVAFTRKQIKIRLVRPGILRNPQIREVVDEVMRDLGDNQAM